MSGPTTVPCAVDVWTEVASNVEAGVVDVMGTANRAYLQTWRLTGDPVPTAGDPTEGAGVFEDGETQFIIKAAAGAPIDVYVFVKGVAGAVRVSV